MILLYFLLPFLCLFSVVLFFFFVYFCLTGWTCGTRTKNRMKIGAELTWMKKKVNWNELKWKWNGIEIWYFFWNWNWIEKWTWYHWKALTKDIVLVLSDWMDVKNGTSGWILCALSSPSILSISMILSWTKYKLNIKFRFVWRFHFFFFHLFCVFYLQLPIEQREDLSSGTVMESNITGGYMETQPWVKVNGTLNFEMNYNWVDIVIYYYCYYHFISCTCLTWELERVSLFVILCHSFFLFSPCGWGMGCISWTDRKESGTTVE